MTNRFIFFIKKYSSKALGLLLISSSAFWLSCSNSNEEINQLTGLSKSNQMDKAQDVKIYYSDNGQVKAVITAKEFYRTEEGTLLYTDVKKGLKVEFYNDSLKIVSTLTALNARIYENEGNVVVRYQVHVVNKKGEQLLTDELVWNQKLDQFYTDKKVKIILGPQQIMYGEGLTANADFSWYKINKLTGNLEVDAKGVPQ